MNLIERLSRSLNMSSKPDLQSGNKTDSPFIQDMLLAGDVQTNVKSQFATIVVYNPLNIEAILAASEIKRHFDHVQVLAADQLIPSEDEIVQEKTTFVWIGVTLGSDRLRAMRIHKASHRLYSSRDGVVADDTGYRPTLIERVCVDMGIHVTARRIKLGYLASQFHEPTGPNETKADKLAALVETWAELRAALVHLNGDNYMSRVNMSAQTIYLEDMARAKRKISGNYRLMMSKDGHKAVRTLVTHFNDHLFILALRLIGLSHTAFMNHWVSSNGTLLYTNIYRPHLHEEEKISPILLS